MRFVFRKDPPAVTALVVVLLLAVTPPAYAQFPDVVGDQSLFPLLNRLNFQFSVQDLFIPSQDLPIVFSRSYNSDLGPENSSALGRGWIHAFSVHLQKTGESSDTVILRGPDGRGYVFARTPDGSYISPPLIHAVLTEDLGRTAYTLTFKDKKVYRFSKEGFLKTIRTPNGNSLRLTYDEHHQLRRVDASSGAWLDLTYSPEGWLTGVRDSAGRSVRYLHDGAGLLIGSVDVFGNKTVYRYDSADRLISVRDPLGRVSAVTYGPEGNLRSVTDSEGHTTAYEFISSGFFESHDGEKSYFPNRLVVTDPLGGKTLTTYNDLGMPLSRQDENGGRTFYTWDSSGDLTGVADAAGNRTEWVYDEQSNLISVTDSLRNTVEFLYDGEGRLIEARDPRGNATRYAYDSAGHLTQAQDPEGGIVKRAYTPEGDVSVYRDPEGRAVGFAYNAMGRVTTMTDAGNKTVSYRYDPKGDLVEVVNQKGEKEKVSFDAANRLTALLSPDGSRREYLYDKVGRMVKAMGPEGAIEIAYNASDLPIEVTDPYGNKISYRYDALGRRAGMTGPGGRETRYTYDPAGRLTELTQPDGEVIRFEYDAVGRRTALIFPNGVRTRYRYDSVGDLLEVKSEDTRTGGVISDISYAYDELGNCVSRREGEGETVYAYDKLSRLVRVTEPSGRVTAYTYDKVGNRLTKTVDGTTERFVYNELDQLVSQGKTRYAYDAVGNRVLRREANGRATRYFYNSDNLLEKASLPEGKTVEYRYDPLGRRIAKIAPGAATRYAYDAEDAFLELDGRNQPLKGYLHGPGLDDLLGSTDYTKGGTSYFLTDRLGSVTGVLDPAGKVKSAFAYGPFGEPAGSLRGGPMSPHYTGRPLDAETGLYYYRNRYYAPDSGCFTTRDPLGLAAGPNLYAYVGNNPINWVDPWGLDYWIEGSSPGEPSAHQSINVGDPNGQYSSYSFGWDMSINWTYGLEGQVYRDPMIGGPILPGFYRQTTSQENAVIKAYLDSQVAVRGPYTPWSNCRTWTQSQFLFLARSGFGKDSSGPAARNSAQQSQSLPFFSSTVTSSEPYGFPSGITNFTIDWSNAGASVPEPATFVLAGLGLAALGIGKRRKTRKR